MRLRGRRVLLGVTGGISVYKICELVRLLKKSNIDVQVLMTEEATKFVSPETFRVLSQREVLISTFDYLEASRVEHVQLAQEADLMVIAPATANTLAKFANGIADNMLTCTFLAYKGKVVVFPSMNSNMYQHPATQRNISILKNYKNVEVMEPASGELACGVSGKGRLPEPEEICEEIIFQLSVKDFDGKKVLVTAGPTREHIDPVRFLSNPSSGKMGYAIAKAAARRGADVWLVSGPTNLKAPNRVRFINVCSAREMFEETRKIFSSVDILIMSAAVADYRPKTFSSQKIKKEETRLKVIELEKNPDIILELSKIKSHQFVVGFAAETEEVLNNAKEKMNRKKMDMIVANLATQAFQKDTNKVIIIHKDGTTRFLPEMPKEEVADEILDEISLKI